jgi:hypothetical protein
LHVFFKEIIELKDKGLKKKKKNKGKIDGVFQFCLKSTFESPIFFSYYTTRNSINLNGNTEGIFSLVNCRWILLTEIFPRYLPRELQWEKMIKKSKNIIMTCHFYQQNHYLSCQLQRGSPTDNSVGILQRVLELFTSQLHC